MGQRREGVTNARGTGSRYSEVLAGTLAVLNAATLGLVACTEYVAPLADPTAPRAITRTIVLKRRSRIMNTHRRIGRAKLSAVAALTVAAVGAIAVAEHPSLLHAAPSAADTIA